MFNVYTNMILGLQYIYENEDLDRFPNTWELHV